MEKLHFTLPRAFAEQWIAALRSGNYKQGRHSLRYEIIDEATGNVTVKHCCLGVAGEVCGVPQPILKGNQFLTKEHKEEHKDLVAAYPDELLFVDDAHATLASLLASMNDGNFSHNDSLAYGLQYQKQYSFSEIADFIEDRITLID